MKQRNAEIQQRISDDAPVFQAVRRSDFPMQIRLKMAQKGLKNVDLAERLGVSEANISRWLRGNQNLSVDTMHLLADAIEEKLSISVGTAGTESQAPGDDYNSICPALGTADVREELEAAALLEERALACNVIRMADYASLRQYRTPSDGLFHAASSGVGMAGDYDDRMVN